MLDAGPLADAGAALAFAATLPGWTGPEEAAALLRTAQGLPCDATIVEVGAFMGRCSLLLAWSRAAAGGGRVHCVDPFDCSGEPYSVPFYQHMLAESGHADLYRAFDANMRAGGVRDWIETHRCTGQEAARDWRRPIDLLLLDADQSVTQARALYDTWLPHLQAGGVLVMCNTGARDYAPDHDGYRRIAVGLGLPEFAPVRHVVNFTFASLAG